MATGHSTKSKQKPLPVPEGTAKRRGRPSPYKAEYAELVQSLTLMDQAYTTKAMAEVFRVSESTIKKWLTDHPDFSAAIAYARDPANARVIDALYRSACGYELMEVQLIKVKNNGVEKVERHLVPRHYPPNPVAIQFFAKNRMPGLWKSDPEPKPSENVAPVTGIKVTIQQSVPPPTESFGDEE